MDFTQEEKEFWDKLKRWHLDDIDICLANNANYAATKMMLSFIDILGGFHGGLIHIEKDDLGKKIDGDLVRAGGGGRSNKITKVNNISYEKSGSRKEFLNFVKNYINEFNRIRYKTGKKNWSATEILYDCFRCGLMHEGYSKFGTGIIKSNDREIIKLDIPNIPIVLNIVYLRDLVRRATFEFENDVFKKKLKYKIIRWKDRYDYLTSEFKL